MLTMTPGSQFAKVGRIGRSYPRAASFTSQQAPTRGLSRGFKITGALAGLCALAVIGWLLAR